MARSSAGWLVLAFVASSCLAAGADDPGKVQAPAGSPKDAGAAKAEDSKRVAVSIVFLTDLNVVPIAVETDPLVKWVKPVIAAVEARFRDETRRRTVVIQVTLHPDRPADVTTAGQPAPSEAEVRELLRLADAREAPRSRVVDCSFRIVAGINGAPAGPDAPLNPRLETPDERRFAAFRAASTAAKLDLLRKWARAEALPILAASAGRAEERFPGVRDLGRAIGKLDPGRPVDVAAMTDRNPAYWRAMLEMTPGDPFVAAVRVALHAANGEIDRARRYANVATFFDARNSASSRLLGEFRAMMVPFYKDVESRISAGIALNDRGRLAEAMAAYDGVLKDYPGSAWAHYERVQTRMAMAAKEGKPIEQALADWPEARAAMLACDPLYELEAQSTGAEGIFRLTRRIAIKSLFQDRRKAAQDVLSYADIARDLEVYGFAAMLYWNLLSGVKPEAYGGRQLIEDFLYCLEELGVKNLKENFRGDHAAAFARIKADRKKRVEAGPGTDEKPQPAAGKADAAGGRPGAPKR